MKVVKPKLFQTTPDTSSMNEMLKLAGQGLESLASENTVLHRSLLKESQKRELVERELSLYKVAHDLARLGHLRDQHVPSKVSQWLQEGRDANTIRQLYALGGDRSSVETAKTSGRSLDGQGKVVQSSAQDSSKNESWVSFAEQIYDIANGR